MFSDSDDELIYNLHHKVGDLIGDVDVLKLEIQYKDTAYTMLRDKLTEAEKKYDELYRHHKDMMKLCAQVVD